MEENKQVVLKKYDFECRDLSKLRTFLTFSTHQRSNGSYKSVKSTSLLQLENKLFRREKMRDLFQREISLKYNLFQNKQNFSVFSRVS